MPLNIIIMCVNYLIKTKFIKLDLKYIIYVLQEYIYQY